MGDGEVKVGGERRLEELLLFFGTLKFERLGLREGDGCDLWIVWLALPTLNVSVSSII